MADPNDTVPSTSDHNLGRAAPSQQQQQRANQQPTTSFQPQTIEQLCKMFFSNEKTKLNSEPLLLTTELMRIYTLEAYQRAARQADSEGCDSVTAEHIEKILPQLLLDFA
eukprot:TRINITY_DN8603_c0_g1_i1.p1 TRINITY_DN8603_c0_g1~~TRINITY_DN8603_c0_g1_i1.p1  ORF type:complete len:110 (+),score=24.38 TRINITY_DN8603_c0_g1_i1:328-657(+)